MEEEEEGLLPSGKDDLRRDGLSAGKKTSNGSSGKGVGGVFLLSLSFSSVGCDGFGLLVRVMEGRASSGDIIVADNVSIWFHHGRNINWHSTGADGRKRDDVLTPPSSKT